MLLLFSFFLWLFLKQFIWNRNFRVKRLSFSLVWKVKSFFIRCICSGIYYFCFWYRCLSNTFDLIITRFFCAITYLYHQPFDVTYARNACKARMKYFSCISLFFVFFSVQPPLTLDHNLTKFIQSPSWRYILYSLISINHSKQRASTSLRISVKRHVN